MEREKFEEKAKRVKEILGYFLVEIPSGVIFAENYEIVVTKSKPPYEKVYLYCCKELIAKLRLDDVEDVNYL